MSFSHVQLIMSSVLFVSRQGYFSFGYLFFYRNSAIYKLGPMSLKAFQVFDRAVQ